MAGRFRVLVECTQIPLSNPPLYYLFYIVLSSISTCMSEANNINFWKYMKMALSYICIFCLSPC